MNKMLTLEWLRKTLDYDPSTGQFRWKTRPSSKCKIGEIAGGVCKTDGYRHIRLQKHPYRCARLAIFITTGRFPENYVDHINGDKADDRISNLREATVVQNGQNTRVRSDCASGLKGAHFNQRRGKYTSSIKVGATVKNLGAFDTAEEAHFAYSEAAKRYFGEFARA